MSEQEQTIEQRSNDHVTVLFKTKPGCIIKMEVHVSTLGCKAANEKAMKEVKKEISLPGFRKGKVPEEIVAKQFSAQIERHAKEVLMETAFKEGVSLIGRNPFTTRSVRKSEIKQLSKDGSAVILFEYEATPDVPDVDISQLSLSQRAEIAEPSDEDIFASLTKLKIIHGAKTAVEHRPVQEGDLVTITLLDLSQPDNQTPTHLIDNEQFYVKKGFLPDWMLEVIAGMNIGDTKETISVPENVESPTAIGKPCKVVINAIHECAFPEEDDLFAQKAGAQSIDDLKQKLKDRAKQEKKIEEQTGMRLELRNELIRQYAFDLPQSLIEGETEARYRPFLEMAEKQGSTDIDKEASRREIQEEVKRYFTCLFLMERIAKEAKPTYSQSEFFDELTYQMIKAPFYERAVYPGLSQEEIQQRILMSIMMKKCYDWCIDQKLKSA